MPLYRCPRCRAEDISADAHPTRFLQGGEVLPRFVCRACYRPAELEFRIACETNGLPYSTLPIREGLRRLVAFYRDRREEWEDPDLLVDMVERLAGTSRIRAALEDVERRLSIDAV